MSPLAAIVVIALAVFVLFLLWERRERMRVRFLNAGQPLEPLPPGAELVSQRVFPLSFRRAGFPPLPEVPLKVDGVTGHFWGEKHFPGPVANTDRLPDEVTGMHDVLVEHGKMEQVGEIEAWRAPKE